MDTDALRWFQQVADGVTVTEVSDLEMVSQSGVSRSLARLEAEVGTPLLRRAGRTLRMTHAGAEFKRHVDVLLHALDDGQAAISQLIDPESGTVALAFQQSLGAWLVPDLIRSFRVEHPGIRFALTQIRDDVVTATQEVAGEYEDSEMFERNMDLQERAEMLNSAAEALEQWEPEDEPEEDAGEWTIDGVDYTDFEEAQAAWLEAARESLQTAIDEMELP